MKPMPTGYKPVVVTTAHKGVFFGYIDPKTEMERSLKVYGARCAIRWTGTKGFLGLSSHGPETDSLIGSTAPCVLLHDITSVSDCTPEAVSAWLSA